MNVKAVVLPVVVSDGLGLFIEPELLLSGVSSPSLEDHVGSTKHLGNLIQRKLRNKIEWSIDVKSELLVETLSLNLVSLIEVNNIPDLSSLS